MLLSNLFWSHLHCVFKKYKGMKIVQKKDQDCKIKKFLELYFEHTVVD
jgi:hypothetical protein